MSGLEGLAAVGLAANVVQFIDAGCKLFCKSHSLYKSASGMAVEDWELEQVAKDMEELSLSAIARLLPKGLAPSLTRNGQKALPILAGLLPKEEAPSLTKSEQSLCDIALACHNLASDLKGIMRSYKIDGAIEGPQRRLRALQVALQRMKKSGKIDSMTKRLDMLGRQISTSLVMNMR